MVAMEIPCEITYKKNRKTTYPPCDAEGKAGSDKIS